MEVQLPNGQPVSPQNLPRGRKVKAIGKGVAQRALVSALQLWGILINAESRDDPTTTSDPQGVKLSP
jgi:hypothetical protein